MQELLGPTFKVTDIGGFGGNNVEVIPPNGAKPFIYNANLKGAEAIIKKAQLEKFIKDNGAPVEGAKANQSNVDYKTK